MTVTVGVAPDSKTYTVPKPLLRTITWFDTALREAQFKEGATNHIKLPDDSAEAFEAFIYYLYHDRLAFETVDCETVDCETAEGVGEEQFELCCKTWIFGDKYNIPGMQNAALMRVCELLINVTLDISPQLMETCYSSTTKNAPLRKVIGDYIIWLVQEKEVPMATYESLALYSGFLEDIYDAQNAYHKNSDFEFGLQGKEFPRYDKPIKYQHLFCLETAIDEKERVVHRENSDWVVSGTTLCQECGLVKVDSRCDSCGVATQTAKCFECAGVGDDLLCISCQRSHDIASGG